MTTDNVTDLREWEADRLIARDEHDFHEAMTRARAVYERHPLGAPEVCTADEEASDAENRS